MQEAKVPDSEAVGAAAGAGAGAAAGGFDARAAGGSGAGGFRAARRPDMCAADAETWFIFGT